MQAAYIVGMGVGAIMTLAASYVLLKRQNFSLSSLGFTALGVLLIGMSVWSQFKIQITKEGAVIEAIREQVEETAESVLAIAEEVNVAAEALEVNRAQFNELATALARERVISPEALQRLVRPTDEMPTIDRAKLDTARIRLDRVIQAQPTRREFR
jgi:hypothetical protein